MQDEILFSVTRVTDDDTGMYSIGELDYGIRVGALESFLRSDPAKKRNEIFAMMGMLNVRIDEYVRQVSEKQEQQESARDVRPEVPSDT
jgi:hypothetical protein